MTRPGPSLYHAGLAPSGHNSQPWRAKIESPRLWTVEVDDSRQLPAVDPNNRELLLSIGAFVENLSIAAGVLGLSAETDVVENHGSGHPAVHIALHKDKPTGYPMERIQKRRAVKNGHRQSWPIFQNDLVVYFHFGDGSGLIAPNFTYA
jgi:hypothetical protein